MMTTVTDLRWQRDAACLECPQEWWFPNHETLQSKYAKEICRACLVRRECLIFAMEGSEDHGIWGGFGVRDIDAYKRARCRRCGQRISVGELADLIIRKRDPGELCCLACWYRGIAERRRT